MNQLKIRKATIDDATTIASLVNSAYRPELGVPGWTHESHMVSGERTNAGQIITALEDSTVLVGLYGDEIVACVQLECEGADAHIGMLAVTPTLQTAGLGKAMLSHAESYAASFLGAQRFVLLVLETRAELIQFYLRRGYEPTGEALPYPSDSGVGVPRSENLELIILHKRPASSWNADAPPANGLM